jgi:hypothetical protein
MITVRSSLIAAMLLCGALHSVAAQTGPDANASRRELVSSWRRALPHYGKWVTALSAVAFTVFAQREHNQSQHVWNSLLDVCHSAQDACAIGPDGRYVQSDAEQLYQRSRAFDRRANRWLFGAQASLLVSASLFIIDLHPGEGPGNIPYPAVQVGMRLSF